MVEADLPPIFKWFESGRVAASGRPADRRQLESVAAQGINRIIATSSIGPDTGAISELSMTCVHIPGVAADLDALDLAVEAMKDAYNLGETILIH